MEHIISLNKIKDELDNYNIDCIEHIKNILNLSNEINIKAKYNIEKIEKEKDNKFSKENICWFNPNIELLNKYYDKIFVNKNILFLTETGNQNFVVMNYEIKDGKYEKPQLSDIVNKLRTDSDDEKENEDDEEYENEYSDEDGDNEEYKNEYSDENGDDDDYKKTETKTKTNIKKSMQNKTYVELPYEYDEGYYAFELFYMKCKIHNYYFYETDFSPLVFALYKKNSVEIYFYRDCVQIKNFDYIVDDRTFNIKYKLEKYDFQENKKMSKDELMAIIYKSCENKTKFFDRNYNMHDDNLSSEFKSKVYVINGKIKTSILDDNLI